MKSFVNRTVRESHNLSHRTGEVTVKPGDVVLIKGEEGDHGR